MNAAHKQGSEVLGLVRQEAIAIKKLTTEPSVYAHAMRLCSILDQYTGTSEGENEVRVRGGRTPVLRPVCNPLLRKRERKVLVGR